MKKLVELNQIEDTIYNISEKTSDNKNSIEIILTSGKLLYLIKITENNRNYNMKKFKIPYASLFFCCEITKGKFIISGETSAIYYEQLFDENNQYRKMYYLSDKCYHSGIKISEKIIVLVSNTIIKNGEDNLIFYDLDEKKIITNINRYSYILRPNGFALINKNENIILLCACKKYTSSQKSGIVLINISLNQKEFKETFTITDNFEIYTIFHIDLDSDGKNKKYEFLFVGGFDLEKREGKIKLYKIYDNKVNGNEQLKYLQDIELDEGNDFQGFHSAVTSINACKNTKKLIITCLDGTLYLFSKPNLEFYLDE